MYQQSFSHKNCFNALVYSHLQIYSAVIIQSQDLSDSDKSIMNIKGDMFVR